MQLNDTQITHFREKPISSKGILHHCKCFYNSNVTNINIVILRARTPERTSDRAAPYSYLERSNQPIKKQTKSVLKKDATKSTDQAAGMQISSAALKLIFRKGHVTLWACRRKRGAVKESEAQKSILAVAPVRNLGYVYNLRHKQRHMCFEGKSQQMYSCFWNEH
jgi:hypothetical protein